jgi:hypothetical protein
MAEYYVDPAIAADTGTGTIGDPFGDLQYALNNITQGAAGDRINIKAGTAEILSSPLTLATYGTTSPTKPLGFQGYSSAQGDADFEAGTGIAEIDCNAQSSLFISVYQYIQLQELEIHNATSDLVNLSIGTVFRCEVHNAGAAGIQMTTAGTNVSVVAECHVHDVAVEGINGVGGQVSVLDNFVETGSGSNDFTYGIYTILGMTVQGNIVYMNSSHTASAVGIRCVSVCRHNSVLADNTGTGIGIDNSVVSNSVAAVFEGNLVEGFSGSGGIGIGGGAEITGVLAHNYVSNCATAYDVKEVYGVDNEDSSVSPFAKVGGVSFSNRTTYFQPVATGNIVGGGTNGRNKGAVHRA